MKEAAFVGETEDCMGVGTLQELHSMAHRQQQQMEQQQQLLAARQQRLRFLQAQEAKPKQVVREAEHLCQLRDHLQGQEAQLQRLRALRGQVEGQRISNATLGGDLEAMRMAFGEKERELAQAVARVEQLTAQLEELRHRNHANGTNGITITGHGLMGLPHELERICKEIARKKQQSREQRERMAAQRAFLAQRHEEAERMDSRIRELQERLHRKRTLNQHMAQQVNQASVAKQQSLHQSPLSSNSSLLGLPSNVATVEPFSRDEAPLSKGQPRYQTLPPSARLHHFTGLAVGAPVANIPSTTTTDGTNRDILVPEKSTLSPPLEKPALPPKPNHIPLKPTPPPRQREQALREDSLHLNASEHEVPSLPVASVPPSRRDIGADENKDTSIVPAVNPSQTVQSISTQAHLATPVTSSSSTGSNNPLSITALTPVQRVRKGSLKTKESGRQVGLVRRVSFDPLALLLDAALEGELELVKRSAREVTDPSAANDEGITALHNAICAGHADIVIFLVKFGCDVNAPDSDGWTPLHCAASCNNLSLVQFLVESGACLLATTLSDQETAADKCEEDEEGFQGCSQYLYGVQEKLGVANAGVVYAVYSYEAQNPDEFSLEEGEKLVIVHRGDEIEKDWWWAKRAASNTDEQEGYVPRNLLGLYPRLKPQQDPDPDWND